MILFFTAQKLKQGLLISFGHSRLPAERKAVDVLASVFESDKEEKPVIIRLQGHIVEPVTSLLSESKVQ